MKKYEFIAELKNFRSFRQDSNATVLFLGIKM